MLDFESSDHELPLDRPELVFIPSFELLLPLIEPLSFASLEPLVRPELLFRPLSEPLERLPCELE